MSAAAPPLAGLWQGLAFARAFYGCALRPAITRALPIYLAMLLVAGLVKEALPLHALLEMEPRLLPLLATAWVLALGHVRAPLFGAPATEYLRSLPIGRPLLVSTIVGGLLAVDSPFLLLCAASGDPQLVAAGGGLTAALHVMRESRRWRVGLAAPLLIAIGWLLPTAGLPVGLLIAPALLAIGWAAPSAWAVTRTGRSARRGGRPGASPARGLAQAYFTVVIASQQPLLRRAALLLAVQAAIVTLALRNNEVVAPASMLRVSLAVLAAGLPLLTPRLTADLLEAGWSLGWLADAAGVDKSQRTRAGLVIIVASGAVYGGLHAVAVLLASSSAPQVSASHVSASHVSASHVTASHGIEALLGPAAWLLPAGVIGGAALAVVALGATAASVEGERVDLSRASGACAWAALIGTLAIGFHLAAGLVVWALAAIASALVYHRQVARPRP